MGRRITRMFNKVGERKPPTTIQPETMKDKIFNLLEQINREGIENGIWGVAEGIDDTRSYFGTEERENLRGCKMIYIYMGADDEFSFIKTDTADLRMRVADDNELLIWLV